MAHMWFNAALVSDRWVEEGFASYYAEQTVDRLGYTDHAPVLTDRMRQSRRPAQRLGRQPAAQLPADAYLYGASLEVASRSPPRPARRASRGSGRRRGRGAMAFQPADRAGSELGGGETDWRRLLDLLEQTTGGSYSSIWEAWVVDAV